MSEVVCYDQTDKNKEDVILAGYVSWDREIPEILKNLKKINVLQ